MKHGQLASLHLHIPIADLRKITLLSRDAVKICFLIDSVESLPSLSRTCRVHINPLANYFSHRYLNIQRGVLIVFRILASDFDVHSHCYS